MLRHRSCSLLALALAVGAAPLTAQMPEDRSTAIITAMYTKLQKIFAPEGKTGPTSYLTLANPGVRFDPKLDPKTNPDDDFLMARMLDDALMPAPQYTTGTMSISSVYEYIFAFKEQPDFKLSENDQKELQRLMDLTSDTSPKYQAYLDRQSKYLDAIIAYESAKANGSTPALLNTYQTKVNNAQNAWNTQGYKQEIESAQEKIQELNAKDPGFWWNNLRNRMNAQFNYAADGKTGYYKTWTYPQYSDWGKDEGWTTYKLSDSEVEATKTSKQVDSGFEASYGKGLWNASASASYKSNHQNSKTTVKNLSIEMQVKAVNIYRPWLEGLVLKSKTWRFNATANPNRVAEGDMAKYKGLGPNQLPMMPLIPVRLILAKGIKFKGQFSQEEKDLFERSIKTKVNVSYGPISVGGHYNQDDSKDYFNAKMSDAGIEAPDVQIIGYVCDIVPKCPNPDMSLPFAPAPIKKEDLRKKKPKA
jgi:hypothetical protein